MKTRVLHETATIAAIQLLLLLLLLLAEASPIQSYRRKCRLKFDDDRVAKVELSTSSIECQIRRCGRQSAVQWLKDGVPIYFDRLDGASIAMNNSLHFWSPYLGLDLTKSRRTSQLIMSLVTPELAGNYTCSLCEPDQLDVCPAKATVSLSLDEMHPSTKVLQNSGNYPPLLNDFLIQARSIQLNQRPSTVYLSRRSDANSAYGLLDGWPTLSLRLVVLKPSAASVSKPPSVRWLQEYNSGRRLKPAVVPSGKRSIRQVRCQPDDLGFFRIPEQLKDQLVCYNASLTVLVDRDSLGDYSCEVALNGARAFKSPAFLRVEIPTDLLRNLYAAKPIAPSSRSATATTPLPPLPPRRAQPQELRIPTISFSTNTSKCAGSSVLLLCRILPGFSKMNISFWPAGFGAKATPIGSYSPNVSQGLQLGPHRVIAQSRSHQDAVLPVRLDNLNLSNSGWYSCSGEVLDKSFERWPQTKFMHLDVVPHCYRSPVDIGLGMPSHSVALITVSSALLFCMLLSLALYFYFLYKRRSAPIIKKLRIVNVDNSALYRRNQSETSSDSPLLGRGSYYRQESHDRPGASLAIPEVTVERIGPRGRRLFNRRGGSGNSASEANREVRYIIPASPVHEVDRSRIYMVRKIGQGAFGTVHAGQIAWSGGRTQDVAVKMLKRDYSEEEMIALVKEMEIMKMLWSNPHPNIVRLVGVCTRGGPALLLVELAQYGNLRDFLKERRVTSCPADYVNVLPGSREACVKPCLPHVQLLHFSRDVARALQFMADIKVVHRDIAARNILVDNAPGRDGIVAKVADFGLTRNISEKDYYRVINEGKLPVKWLAPECLKSRVFSTQTDVWAFGILLYEIFSKGDTPYPGVSPSAVLPHLESGGRNPQPHLAGPLLYSLMSDCWAWEPQNRPNFETILTRMAAIEPLYARTDLP